MYSYPEKHAKKKKIVRKEIKIARIDLANKLLTEKLAAQGLWFPLGANIMLLKEGRMFKYDGPWGDVTVLMHQMQRTVNPLITLTSEEEVLGFLDNYENQVIESDFTGGIVGKGTNFDSKRVINGYLKDMRFNTRVIAFFYDKSEFSLLRSLSL